MSDTLEWKAEVLPAKAADPSGTQTIWIDEEHAAKNLIKSGDYVFVSSNAKIGLVSVSLKSRSQMTSTASLSALCANLLALPKELSEHTLKLALPSLKDNQLSFATKVYVTLMPPAKISGPNSTTAPVLANFMADMIPTLLMNTAIYTGCKIPINWYNQWNTLLVTKVEGKQHQTKEFQIGSSKISLEMPYFIADNTRIEILPWKDEYFSHELTLDSSTSETSLIKPKSRPLKQWKDEISLLVGGLDHVINKITHLINFQLDFQNHALSSVGHNVLLYGPHGTGKSLLATQIAKTSGLQMFFINGPEIFQKLEGDSEVMLMNIFEKARANAPSILIFDDLNSVASSRKGEIGITEKRIVTQLIEELDKNSRLFPSKKVFVIGICTDLKDIDESLVKPNRFDMTLEVSIPNNNQRLEILKVLSKKLEIVDKDEVLQKVSAEAHGFSGSELNNILQLAVLEASNINKEGAIGEGKVVLQRDHLLNAMNKIQPLSLVELNTDFKKISFDDIGGLGPVIDQVKKIIIEPLHSPAIFTRLGLKVPSGILLYGPPGTGKSMLVQAIATASGINFISIQGTELLSKYVGDTERLISKVFAKARASAPAILFIDQLEAIAPKRTLEANSSDNRALSSLLIEMQGIGKDFGEQRLLVLGATNKPEGLDDAILRPGRFDYHIFIPPPDIQGRKDILKKKLEVIQNKLSQEEIEHLAYQTGGFSGADLENLIRETAMISLRENIDNAQIEKRHVVAAQEVIKGTLPVTVTHPYNRQPATNTGFVFNL